MLGSSNSHFVPADTGASQARAGKKSFYSFKVSRFSQACEGKAERYGVSYLVQDLGLQKCASGFEKTQRRLQTA